MLMPVFVESKQIHMYHAVSHENQLDSLFFICALIHPGRICGFLESETDSLMANILDPLEVASAQYRNADCDHIVMSFVYNLAVSYEDVPMTCYLRVH